MTRSFTVLAVSTALGLLVAAPATAQINLSQASFEAGVNFAAFFKV